MLRLSRSYPFGFQFQIAFTCQSSKLVVYTSSHSKAIMLQSNHRDEIAEWLRGSVLHMQILIATLTLSPSQGRNLNVEFDSLGRRSGPSRCFGYERSRVAISHRADVAPELLGVWKQASSWRSCVERVRWKLEMELGWREVTGEPRGVAVHYDIFRDVSIVKTPRMGRGLRFHSQSISVISK